MAAASTTGEVSRVYYKQIENPCCFKNVKYLPYQYVA